MKHIHSIVLQAPFQCHLCRFYFNLSEQFVEHWQSHHGENREQLEATSLWCSACRIRCYSERAMLFHLMSVNHAELVTMIHRSVPIVIKKVSLISCPVEACVQRFRLQFSLQRHLASSHPHWQQQQVANEESWQVKCSSCSFTAPSKSALKKHTFWAHNRQATSALSCRACHRSFGSNLAWIRHQSSQTHRRKMKDKGLSISQCHLCGQLLANESCWENHLYSEHFEDLSQCHRCGRLFTNPQQLGRHVRKLPSACHGEDNPSQLLKDRGYPCSRQSCRFVAHRPLILQLHLQAVHTTISSWSCPLCPSKTFSSRSKLERHLGAHQGGSSHRCPRCHGIFLTKNSLSAHLCSSGSAQVPHLRCPMASCSYTTTKTSSLKSHWLIHKGRLNTALPQFSSEGSDPFELRLQQEYLHIMMEIGPNAKKNIIFIAEKTFEIWPQNENHLIGNGPYNVPHYLMRFEPN